MARYHHPYDPAYNGISPLQAEPSRAKFEVYGPSWPQAFYVALLRQTERQLSDYRKAVEDESVDLTGPRERMRGFLGNALKIMQTIERGHVAEADWRAYQKECVS
ncbi:MAG: hypothetical protein AAFO91_09900 [Bacteroidota bacterium]